MKHTYWLILILIVSGCASIDPAVLSEKERLSVVGLAREKVLLEIPDISQEEIYFIKNEQPKSSYYKLSGHYADYTFNWIIKDNQGIVVHVRGDILTLEGAKIERFYK